MSSSASTPRNPFKNSFPSWRAQSLSKNSSPAALTFALAQAEHAAPLASAKSKLPTSVRSVALHDQEPLQEEVNSQLNGCEEQVLSPVPFRRSGRAASECVIETSSLPLSKRITRAAHPAYMTVRGHKKTLPESPVASTGWLSTHKAKGKEKEIGQGQSERVETEPQVIKTKGKEEPLDVPNVDSSPPSTSKLRAEQVPTNIPSTTIPTTQFTSSSAAADTSATQNARDSTSSHKPTNDNSASSNSTIPSAAPLDISSNLNPVPARNAQSTNFVNEATSNQESLIDKHDQPSTLPEASPASQAPPSKAAAESSAKGGSWFSASWLGWSDSTRHHGDLSTQRTDGDNHDDGHADNEISDGQEGKFHERGQPASSTITVSSSQIDGTDSQTTPAISRGDEKAKSIPADTQVVVFTPEPAERLPGGNSTTGPTTTGSGSTGRSPIATCEPNGATPSTCRPVPQDSRGPTTELETENRVTTATITNTTTSSWWDYVGWRSPPVGNVDSTASVNTGSGTGQCSSTMAKPVADDRKNERGGQESTAQESASVTITGESEGVVSAVQPPASPFLLPPTPPSTNPPIPSHVRVPGPKNPRELEQTSSDSGGRGSTEEDIRKGQDQVQVQTQGGSSWYNPWAWYGASYTPSVGTAHAGLEGSEKEAQDEKVEEVNATAQDPVEVREGAPPQELHVQVSPPSPPVPDPGSGEEVNPVAATIDSHRSSWISFFSSRTPRTLVMKSITGPGPDSASAGEGSTNNVKVDENGMEVMDIDDEADSPSSFTGKEPEDPSKPKEDPKEKETKALSTLSPSQGLVAALVRGRGRIRTQSRPEQDSPKEGNSETSSIRSAGGGQGSGAATPVNGIAIPSKQGAEPSAAASAAIASSVPSSPSSTTSLVKRASLTLTSVGTKAAAGNTSNGNGNNIANTTNTETATATATITTANSDKIPKSISPTPSPTSKKPIGPPPPPNLVLPSWQDTFHTAPRSVIPHPEAGTLTKTMQYVSGLLFSGGRSGKPRGSTIFSRKAEDQAHGSARTDKGKRRANSVEREREREQEFAHFGKVLPRAWDVLEPAQAAHLKRDVLHGSRRVVVIGVHGWFPGTVMRTVIGEPTGTSSKFANMLVQALEEFENEHGVKFDKITKIPLEGEGTIKRRIDKLYSNLLGNKEWMDDIQAADAILVATHSQGSVVSTHLLDRLVADKHIRTSRNSVVTGPATSFPAAAGVEIAPAPRAQRVCCLAMCGIHLGPLRYLSTSSLFQPYFQYLESPAARELFEFQNTDSEASKEYAKALGNVLNNGVKMLYVASLNDQVVPIYSGLFTAASHPLILRALYIDGDAYNSSDFLANLLVLLLRILNSGLSDSGLLVHLSEATAGSLSGVGHSTAYEEIATYSLAVKYLFLTSDGFEEHPELVLDSFNARQEQNDYEIPWALRDVIADDSVTFFFKEILQLRDAFRDWHPRTSILRDLKRKLQPIQRLPASFATSRL